MTDDPREICAALRAYRIRGRIRQQMVARALGVAQSQISRWESGRDLPRPHNIEAIKALIRGETATQTQALIQFVRQSALPLALFDGEFRLLAAGLPYQHPRNALERFAWVLDPASNPAVVPIRKQYRANLTAPHNTAGLDIKVPFDHGGIAWLLRLRGTMQTADGRPVFIAEMHFSSRGDGPQMPETMATHLPA
jgi:transcriptional regulator with XRE-family HTH domain